MNNNYDKKNKRKHLLQELDDLYHIWGRVHAFRFMQYNADSYDVFFVIEAMTYLSLQTAKANRYVDWKPMYRKDHVQESLMSRVQYHMNHSSFNKLHDLIKYHPIFIQQERKRGCHSLIPSTNSYFYWPSWGQKEMECLTLQRWQHFMLPLNVKVDNGNCCGGSVSPPLPPSLQ